GKMLSMILSGLVALATGEARAGWFSTVGEELLYRPDDMCIVVNGDHAYYYEVPIDAILGWSNPTPPQLLTQRALAAKARRLGIEAEQSALAELGTDHKTLVALARAYRVEQALLLKRTGKVNELAQLLAAFVSPEQAKAAQEQARR